MTVPCLTHSCSKCCYKTEMTLTNDDIARISGLGYKDYHFYKNGYEQLVNVSGHCIFLKMDRCAIYEHRPEGCRFYPLILDLDTGEAILHDFCPYTEEFQFTDEDAEKLKELIEREDRERNERVLKRLHELSD